MKVANGRQGGVLDCLILGGGVHGTYLSRLLIEEGGIAKDRLRVLDPHESPLARWRECTEATGMEFLRSAAVHHLGSGAGELHQFARRHAREPWAKFRGPAARPTLDLWNRHAAERIAALGLSDLRLRGVATGLTRRGRRFVVETDRGTIAARNVVLALGSHGPRRPVWARSLESAGGEVRHLYDPGFRRGADQGGSGRRAIVGAGIAGAQAALALAREGEAGRLVLVSRMPITVFPYDVDPCWMGPKCMEGFSRIPDLGARRREIRKARKSGTMPSEIAADLRRAIDRREIELVRGEVSGAEMAAAAGGGAIELTVETDTGGTTLLVDRLLLATGFSPERPGGAWLDRAIADLGLACAPCGFPIVDRRLAWREEARSRAESPGSNLFVSGPLAELETGPVARNVLGARLAGRQILAALRAA